MKQTTRCKGLWPHFKSKCKAGKESYRQLKRIFTGTETYYMKDLAIHYNAFLLSTDLYLRVHMLCVPRVQCSG